MVEWRTRRCCASGCCSPLDGAREFLVGKQQLDQDLADWKGRTGRAGGSTVDRAVKLNRARLWLAERPQQLSAAERAFTEASIVQAEAAEAGRRGLRRRRSRGPR